MQQPNYKTRLMHISQDNHPSLWRRRRKNWIKLVVVSYFAGLLSAIAIGEFFLLRLLK